VFVTLLSKFIVSNNLQQKLADYINLAEHTVYWRDFVIVGINIRILYSGEFPEYINIHEGLNTTSCIPELLNISATNVWNAIRGLLEKYPTFGREKETGLLGALDT
jgi:hypothetical protein